MSWVLASWHAGCTSCVFLCSTPSSPHQPHTVCPLTYTFAQCASIQRYTVHVVSIQLMVLELNSLGNAIPPSLWTHNISAPKSVNDIILQFGTQPLMPASLFPHHRLTVQQDWTNTWHSMLQWHWVGRIITSQCWNIQCWISERNHRKYSISNLYIMPWITKTHLRPALNVSFQNSSDFPRVKIQMYTLS